MLPIDQFQGQHLVFAADASAAGNYPFKTPERLCQRIDPRGSLRALDG
jgi:hypothetical protein